MVAPVAAEVGPVRSATGARFETVTFTVSESVLLAGSPSLAVTSTAGVEGPSGKVQSKELAAAVSVLVPPVPQLSVIVGLGSVPASVTV